MWTYIAVGVGSFIAGVVFTIFAGGWLLNWFNKHGG